MSTQRDNHPRPPSNNPPASQSPPRRSFFSVPPAVKRLFDRFPLQTYPASALPARSPERQDNHVLYVFTTKDGAESGAPSFNPGCLKWQTYLRFSRVGFVTVASNNHASPTGALPFLLPISKSKSPNDRISPIASSRFQRWVDDTTPHGSHTLPATSSRQEAYLSLLNHTIRLAWLHSVYQTSNLHSFAVPLYISPTTSSRLVHASLTHDLRLAATKELRDSSIASAPSSSSLVTVPLSEAEVQKLHADVLAAFEALSTLLGGKEWFSGEVTPGLLDAAVFSYTHLLLLDTDGKGEDQMWAWTDSRLRDILQDKTFENLHKHRQRILGRYFTPQATI